MSQGWETELGSICWGRIVNNKGVESVRYFDPNQYHGEEKKIAKQDFKNNLVYGRVVMTTEQVKGQVNPDLPHLEITVDHQSTRDGNRKILRKYAIPELVTQPILSKEVYGTDGYLQLKNDSLAITEHFYQSVICANKAGIEIYHLSDFVDSFNERVRNHNNKDSYILDVELIEDNQIDDLVGYEFSSIDNERVIRGIRLRKNYTDVAIDVEHTMLRLTKRGQSGRRVGFDRMSIAHHFNASVPIETVAFDPVTTLIENMIRSPSKKAEWKASIIAAHSVVQDCFEFEDGDEGELKKRKFKGLMAITCYLLNGLKESVEHGGTYKNKWAVLPKTAISYLVERSLSYNAMEQLADLLEEEKRENFYRVIAASVDVNLDEVYKTLSYDISPRNFLDAAFGGDNDGSSVIHTEKIFSSFILAEDDPEKEINPHLARNFVLELRSGVNNLPCATSLAQSYDDGTRAWDAVYKIKKDNLAVPTVEELQDRRRRFPKNLVRWVGKRMCFA